MPREGISTVVIGIDIDHKNRSPDRRKCRTPAAGPETDHFLLTSVMVSPVHLAQRLWKRGRGKGSWLKAGGLSRAAAHPQSLRQQFCCRWLYCEGSLLDAHKATVALSVCSAEAFTVHIFQQVLYSGCTYDQTAQSPLSWQNDPFLFVGWFCLFVFPTEANGGMKNK